MMTELVALEQLAQYAVQLTLPAIEDADVQSRDGLHPYRAALFFILREQRNSHRTSRQSLAAVMSGDINNIRQWQVVRLLGHCFGKSNTEVARDLIDTYRALEDGQFAP